MTEPAAPAPATEPAATAAPAPATAPAAADPAAPAAAAAPAATAAPAPAGGGAASPVKPGFLDRAMRFLNSNKYTAGAMAVGAVAANALGIGTIGTILLSLVAAVTGGLLGDRKEGFISGLLNLQPGQKTTPAPTFGLAPAVESVTVTAAQQTPAPGAAQTPVTITLTGPAGSGYTRTFTGSYDKAQSTLTLNQVNTRTETGPAGPVDLSQPITIEGVTTDSSGNLSTDTIRNSIKQLQEAKPKTELPAGTTLAGAAPDFGRMLEGGATIPVGGSAASLPGQMRGGTASLTA